MARDENYYCLDKEIPYRKKKGSRKIKKSNHKHEYEEVIVTTDKHRFISKGRQCKVCNKTEEVGVFTEKEEGRHYTRMLNDLEEIKELYPEMKIVKID